MTRFVPIRFGSCTPARSALAFAFVLAPLAASATTYAVTDAGDTLAAGQLRTIIAAAVAGDTVLVPAGTITLVAGTITFGTDVTVIGAGQALTTIDGAGASRVFDVPAGRSVVIVGLTITQGVTATGIGGGVRNAGTLHLVGVAIADCDAEAGGALGTSRDSTTVVQSSSIRRNVTHGLTAIGGGIFNGGVMEVRESLVHDNLAGDAYASANGGGIGNAGDLSVVNSTVSGNRANANTGGGIFHSASGTHLLLINSTIADNRARASGTGGFGGGVSIMGADARAVNTVIADNRVGRSGRAPDCSGTLDSLGHNLVADADGCTLIGVLDGNVLGELARLGPLADNGGPTLTHALQRRSPAIDAADAAWCPVVDQRGTVRPLDGDRDGVVACDIGAFELARR